MESIPVVGRSAAFTVADLQEMLVRCADVPESMIVDDPDIPLVQLDVDSVGVLALQLELEKRYGVMVPADVDWWSMTVGGTASYIDRLIRSGR